MNDFLNLIKKLNIQRQYILLLILRSPFEALRVWMLACLMRKTFFCIQIGSSKELVAECIVYGLICSLLFFYNGTIWSMYAAFAAKVEALLEKMVLRKMMNTSMEEIDSRLSSYWITKLNSDVHAAFTLMNGPLNIPHAMVSIINLTVSSFLLCRCGVSLFLITYIFILPYIFFNKQIVLKHLPGLKEEAQNALSESTAAIKPLITEADAILVFDASDLMMEACEKSSRKLMKINIEIQRRKALSGVALRFLGLSGYLVMMFLGFCSIYNGKMTFAELTYSFQMRGGIIAALLMLTSCINNIKANLVCVKRIGDNGLE